jgi:hypothetical protein
MFEKQVLISKSKNNTTNTRILKINKINFVITSYHFPLYLNNIFNRLVIKLVECIQYF